VRRRWAEGEHILQREVWNGRVWAARPATVVADTDELIVAYVAAGTTWKRPVRRDGSTLRMPSEDWVLADDEWVDNHVLHLVTPGAAHAVLMLWSAEDGSFRGWYVNLQEPLHRTETGFDYMDHMLDIVVAPDRSWRWKDQGELEAEVGLGLVTTAAADAVRAEAARVLDLVRVGASPFDSAWVGWRPDPAWGVPGFPPHWNRVH
jgi:predicted RNA-binding protein associated with RNAse of E/G family